MPDIMMQGTVKTVGLMIDDEAEVSNSQKMLRGFTYDPDI